MGIGLDEKLMQAINAEADRYEKYWLEALNVRTTARRLHADHAHRTLEQIEDRLILVFRSRGLPIQSTDQTSLDDHQQPVAAEP